MEPTLRELYSAVLRGDFQPADSLLRHQTAHRMQHERHALPLLHVIAAADAAVLVPAAVAAGVPISQATMAVGLSQGSLDPVMDLISAQAAAALLDRPRVCALTLAAVLGHAATVAALLAAGADPNPRHPDGRSILHPLAAGATAEDEAAALATCRALLAAGADITSAVAALPPAGNWQARSCSWLLGMRSIHVERLILGALLQRWRRHGWRPAGWGVASALVLLAAQADNRRAFLQFASHLPAGRLPSEHAELVKDAVVVALRASCCGGRRGGVLWCMQQLATGGRPRRSTLGSQLHVLIPHLAAQLAASLEGGAADGDVKALQCLLSAGVVVSSRAVSAAVCSGQPAALALLLRHGALPARPLPASTVLAAHDNSAAGEDRELLASDASWPCAYPCPLLTLLAHHARLGLEPLHPDSLEMAEMLVRAGYRPAVYRGMLVRRAEDQQARLVEAFEPAAEDPSQRAAESGSFLWLAMTHPDWSPALHGRFPLAMQRAARTLLLTAARGAATGSASAVHSASAGACGLACLPGHVLEHILRLAAYPLSAWARAPWEAAATWLGACSPPDFIPLDE